MKKNLHFVFVLSLMFNIANAQIDYCVTGKFYDSGGSSGSYSDSENIVTTISKLGYYTEVNFVMFDLQNGDDFLRIYDGPTISSPLLGVFSGKTLEGKTFRATNSSGALTFHFTSDITVKYPGWEANVSCFLQPICLPPKDVASINIKPIEQLVSWVTSGLETSWNVEYGLSGFTKGTGTEVVATEEQIKLTGLTPDTSYDVYITTNCGDGDKSGSTNLHTFTTAFDFCATGKFYDSGGLNGNYSNNEKTITTIVPNVDNEYVKVYFNSFQLETFIQWDNLKVYDGPNISSPLIGEFKASSLTGKTVFSTHPTGALTFEFYSDPITTNQGWDADVICAPIPYCYPPTGISESNTSAFNTTLSWVSTDVETSWNIEYGMSGFTPGNGTVVIANQEQITLSGLMADTNYDAYIYTICDEGGFSDYSDVYTFKTDVNYCEIGKFYDSGGATGNYANKENKITVISPPDQSQYTKVTFNSFELQSGWDYLKIYDGPSTSSPLIGNFSGTSLNGVTIEATNLSGALTFHFTSSNSTTFSGWDADVACLLIPAGSCHQNFYDRGGVTDNYSDWESYVKTFTPTIENTVIEVTFVDFYLESGYDFLSIYNGPSITSPLIGSYSGNSLVGQTITSTDASGALTFYFTSDSSITRLGWDADVNCSVPLSTNSYDKISGLKIYPNPNDGEFYVNIGDALINNIKVYSITGQLVFEQNNILESEYLVKLPSHLNVNMYFLKIESDKGIAFEKIVKK